MKWYYKWRYYHYVRLYNKYPPSKYPTLFAFYLEKAKVYGIKWGYLK